MPTNKKKVYTKNKNSKNDNIRSKKKPLKNSNSIEIKKEIKKEIKGIFIITIAILLLIMTDTKYETGIIGKTIQIIVLALFGDGSKVLPYILIVVGLLYLLKILLFNERKQMISVMGLFVCYLVFCVINNDVISVLLYENISFVKLSELSLSWAKMGEYIGGGLVGNIIAFLLTKLFGIMGTLVIILSLSCILLIVFTNKSITNTIKIIFLAIKKFIVNLFRSIYSFLFIEEKDNNLKARKKKKSVITKDKKNTTALIKKNYPQKEKIKKNNIEIFDFTDDEVKVGANLNNNILNLNLDANQKIKIKNKKQNNSIINEEVVNKDKGKEKVNAKNYILPSPELLDKNEPENKSSEKKEILQLADKLIETLKSFNIECKIVQINKGPSITRYELQPAPGIKVSKILNLTNDIALNLAKSDIRIEAPIPGKAAIGIEVPNTIKSNVYLREIIKSNKFENVNTKVPFAIGKDISGKNVIANIEDMPHLLVAGATGSGKSVCINTLIMSILFKAKPEEVKLILIDPKVVELNIYNGIPHLLVPVVTEPRKAANVLNWAVAEMTNRYKIFAKNSVRDIYSYNKKVLNEPDNDRMAQVVIIIDELADLMIVAPGEVEESITRLAQLARAAGIHLIIATQRPSVDVITGIIKANIPSRIAFAVSSYVDSRTIIDASGAEKLLGKGDMLYFPSGVSKPLRVQGVFVSDNEVKRVINYIKRQNIEIKIHNVTKEIENSKPSNKKVDDLLEKAAELVINEGQASVSLLQRRLRIGYARAARLIDDLAEREIVGPYEGSKPRKVLITMEEYENMKEK